MVSRGGFLSSTCEVSVSPKTKKLECACPQWFAGMGYYSLATYLAHKLEMAIWCGYHEHKRAGKGGVGASPQDLRGVHLRNQLQQFWESLSVRERRRNVLSKVRRRASGDLNFLPNTIKFN